MASNIVVSVGQVQCSICLEVFTDPVSTSCGHNFCKSCISGYWDSCGLWRCPMCQNSFTSRPQLRTNTFIAEMAAQVKRLSVVEGTSSSSEGSRAGAVEVPCDVCPEDKVKAVKTCLVCLASYCQTHLEPHYRVAALRRHKLTEPVDKVEDRVCQKHSRPLELFCRTDLTCVCLFCTEGHHRDHDTVPLEEEFSRRKAELGKMKGDIQELIVERRLKIKEVKQSAESRRTETETETADSVRTFTALVRLTERSQAEVSQLMEEQQRAAEEQAEGFIRELEQEVSELQRRNSEVEQLSQTEDQLHLLHSCPSLSPLATKDWSHVSLSWEMDGDSAMRAVTQLEETQETLREKIQEVKMKIIRQFAVDLTLDPKTAPSGLVLSEDGKQVRFHGNVYQRVPDNPERFDVTSCVLAREGFSSGRFYFEVQVKGKVAWVLSVVRGSIIRKGELVRSPTEGHWAFGLWRDVGYKACAGPDEVIRLRQKPQKVGVFVDCEKGEVSFYDAESRSLLYSFTGCRFRETLYPCFSTGLNDDGLNADPLVICPVRHFGLTL